MAKVFYKKIKKLSPDQSAYLAGIIDGEGTITLTYKKKNTYRQLAITISNTEYEMLKWILKTIGVGRITNKRSYNKKHTPSYTYQIHNRQALNLLNHIYPYLQTHKRERAKLILENYIKLTPRNGRYSTELLEKREKFIDSFFEIKAMT